MQLILKVFGGLQAFVGLVIALYGTLLASDNVAASIYVIGIGFGFIVSGALFWCFGAIVDHLAAIRAASERQASSVYQMEKWAAASRVPVRD